MIPILPASKLAHDYLRTMESRDLEAARKYLAPGFNMVFPGDTKMRTLEELVERPRAHRGVRKVFEVFDEAPQSDGTTVVYCFGTLTGEFTEGTPFEGIRFIDRFTVSEGKFVDQKVWNDMAVRLMAEKRS